jgi:hypothetical protein
MNLIAKTGSTYLAIALLSLSTAAHAWSLKNAIKYTTTAAFLASIVKYNLTKPHNNPERYNLDQLFAGKNIPDNVKYLILDGLIGHGEEKAKLVIDPKDMTIKVDETTKAKPKGIYGHLHAYYLKPILNSLGFVSILNAHKRNLKVGLNDWSKFSLDDLTSL